jgi:kynurenine formamidase
MGATPIDIDPYFDSLSNWGRWGADDQAGTLNLLTPERLVDAAGLVREGVAISCSRKLKPSTEQYLHFMSQSGEAAPESGVALGSDWFGIGCHGFDCTHLDAHSHMFRNGQMYNGRSAALCTTTRGAIAGGVEPAFTGITGRGVLLDGPAALGVDWMEPGQPLMPEDLSRWFELAGVELRSGDILFARFGRDAWEAAGQPTDMHAGFPGLHASCMPMLREKDISVLVSDLVSDVVPSGSEIRLPVHCVALVAMGLWLVDNADLGALAAACAERRRYEFYVSMVPIAVARATGCPINPIAIF